MKTVSRFELCEELLAKGISCVFTATGGSMLPFIHNGDRVIVAPVDGKIKTGDVVLIKDSETGRFIVHRIIASSGKGEYVTKGDNSKKSDGTFAKEEIIGRITGVKNKGPVFNSVVRHGGQIIAFLSKSGIRLAPAGSWIKRKVGLSR